MQIYILRDNQQTGPFTEAEVRAQLAAGTITPETMIWWDGLPEWKALADTQYADAPVSAPVTPTAAPIMPPPVVGNVPMGQKTSGLAIAALATGVVGIFCSFILGPTAIILGHIARSQIKKDPTLTGSGMALAGLILGYIWTACFIAYMIVLVMAGPKIQETFLKIQQQQQQAMQNGGTNTAPTNPDNTPTTPPATPDTNAAPAPATPPSQ